MRVTVGTAGKETCGYEHYAVRMTVRAAGNETCGYEGRAPLSRRDYWLPRARFVPACA